MVEKSLVMTFLNAEEKKVSIRVDGIRDNLTQAEIEAAMDLIIAKNIFKSTGGDFIEKSSAQIIAKDVVAFEF